MPPPPPPPPPPPLLLLLLLLVAAPACAQLGLDTEVTLFTVSGKSSGLCNDGTQPAFWHRKARQGFEDRWLILLEGGGQCDSQEKCEARSVYLTSSTDLPAKRDSDIRGIFTTHDGLETGNYNLVYVHYCSSDSWHGDRVDPFPSSPLKYFQGTRVIDNVFDTLLDPPSSLDLPPLKTSHAVLFGGISAGGRGAMVNADRVQKEYGLRNMRAFMDSSFYVDLDNDYVLVAQAKNAFNLFVQGSAMADANSVESWKDLFGEYRLPKMQAAFLLAASQFDEFQLEIVRKDERGANLTRAQFVQHTREKLLSMQPLNPCSVIFSDTSEIHGRARRAAFFHQGYFDGASDVRLHFLVHDFARGIGRDCDSDAAKKYIDPRGADCTEDDCPAGFVFTRFSDYMGVPGTRCAIDASGGYGSHEATNMPTFRACRDRCEAKGSACFGFEYDHGFVTCRTWGVLVATRLATRSSRACYQRPLAAPGSPTATVTWQVVPDTACRDGSGGKPRDEVESLALSWHDCMSRCIDDSDCTGIEHKAPTLCEIWKAPIASRVSRPTYACAQKLVLEGFQGVSGTQCVASVTGEEAPGDAQRISSGLALSECMDQCRGSDHCAGVNFRDGTCHVHVKPIAYAALGAADEMCLTRINSTTHTTPTLSTESNLSTIIAVVGATAFVGLVVVGEAIKRRQSAAETDSDDGGGGGGGAGDDRITGPAQQSAGQH